MQLYTRAAAAQPAAGPAPATTTLQDENFHNEGVDLRVRKIYGRGNAFSVGVTGTHSDAPFQQFTSTNLSATLGEHSGTPRLDQARDSYYGAVFAENVFRLPHRFHIVFSGRFDTERLRIVERVKPANLTRPLVDVDVSRTKPLFGVGVGNDFFQDSNLATGTGATLVPARVPAYKLFEIDGEYTVTPHVTLQAGIQNLGDERYYSRVFQTGLEPASGRRFFGGVKFGF